MGLCLLTEQKISLKIILGLPSRECRSTFQDSIVGEWVSCALNVNRNPEWELQVPFKDPLSQGLTGPVVIYGSPNNPQ